MERSIKVLSRSVNTSRAKSFFRLSGGGGTFKLQHDVEGVMGSACRLYFEFCPSPLYSQQVISLHPLLLEMVIRSEFYGI